MTQVVNGIYLPSQDTHFAVALATAPLFQGKGTYQLHKLQAALAYVRHFNVAIDVGAHVGTWTRVLASYFNEVHAFEMCQMHRDCFRLNCGDLPNVELMPLTALGATTGWVGFQPEKDNSGNTRVSPDGSLGTQVPMAPLSWFYTPHQQIDFIKIDVEGYEMQVVKGGESLIRSCRPTMVVEQKPGHAERYGTRTGEVIDLLKSWGARTMWQKAGDFCMRWE